MNYNGTQKQILRFAFFLGIKVVTMSWICLCPHSWVTQNLTQGQTIVAFHPGKNERYALNVATWCRDLHSVLSLTTWSSQTSMIFCNKSSNLWGRKTSKLAIISKMHYSELQPCKLWFCDPYWMLPTLCKSCKYYSHWEVHFSLTCQRTQHWKCLQMQ